MSILVPATALYTTVVFRLCELYELHHVSLAIIHHFGVGYVDISNNESQSYLFQA